MNVIVSPPLTWMQRVRLLFARVFPAVDERRAEINRQAEEILDQYGNSILRYAYSYLHNLSDAEEVLQDTLVQFLKTAPRFENETHRKAWLLRVAGNLSKNRLNYNAVRRTDALNEELTAEQQEDLSFVWEAVKALPEGQRAAIHLFYYEGSPIGVNWHRSFTAERSRAQLSESLWTVPTTLETLQFIRQKPNSNLVIFP